jgi:hypothetical protein
MNELSFLTGGEPTRNHHLEHFVYYFVTIIGAETCVSPLAML